MVNQLSDEDSCPEEHRDEGSLLLTNEATNPGRRVLPLAPRGVRISPPPG
jgi:hypothetical protein